jgi:hypothetical protein
MRQKIIRAGLVEIRQIRQINKPDASAARFQFFRKRPLRRLD